MSRNILTGLVGAWCPSLGPSGYTLLDRSGRGNHGTLTNMDAGSDWVGSPGGWALDFDGTNDYVLITNARLPTMGINATISASAWFRVTTVPSGRRGIVPTASIGAGQFGMQLEIEAGALTIRADNAGIANYTYTDGVTVATNVWTHVAGVWDGRAKLATLYRNGQALGSANYSASTASNVTSTRWTVGSLEYEGVVYFYLPGMLDDSVLWNRCLTATEIRQLYQLGRGGLGRLLTQRAQRRVFRTATGNRRRRLICGAEC